MKRSLLLLLIFTALWSEGQAQENNPDWPFLAKYRADNEKRIENKDFPKVVFMGNSITEGWGKQRPEFFTKHNFLSRGIGGQTTPQMLVRFTPDVIDLKPEVVVILAGTNDIAGNTGYASVKMITDNLAAMATLAEAEGIKVVLSSILPVFQYPWSQEVDAVPEIAAVNQWIKAYTEAHGHVYLDYFSHMSDEKSGLKTLYSGDGVHPNLEGYAVMEPLVLKAIEQVQAE